jgi:hypothetical protein
MTTPQMKTLLDDNTKDENNPDDNILDDNTQTSSEGVVN